MTLTSRLRAAADRLTGSPNGLREKGRASFTHEARVRFRVPDDLVVDQDAPLRVLVLGECVAEWLGDGATTLGWSHDFLLINNYSVLPDAPPSPVATYGFQLVQIPLRVVMGEWEYLGLPFDDEQAWREMLDGACRRLTQVLSAAMRYNVESGLLTFVGGFLVPQQNPMGRMLPRDDPRNLVFVVESLNRHMVTEVASYQNAYYVDFDQIASGVGKQYILDDSIGAISHGAMLSDWDITRDQNRLEPPDPLHHHFEIRSEEFVRAVWFELFAMHRTLRGVDQVKLVLVDLDDTLWRGVVAEESDISGETIEGWPIGLIEALQFMKKRGVLLGILSKNDESKIEAVWGSIMRGRLRLEDFVVRKINWKSKAENLEEILDEVNLLSRNVVIVDDNPRERAEIAAAFPDVRVLGADIYQVRRILLWAPETQVPAVTGESSRRTQMVQGQIARERERRKVSREDFLRDLGVEARVFEVRRDDHAIHARALELLNKTNQFNTTGRRWTTEEFRSLTDTGHSVIGFAVRDRFTDYGMVGVVVLKIDSPSEVHIEHVVMSCRVFGLDVERAALVEMLTHVRRSDNRRLVGTIEKVSVNQPCWDLYSRLGFAEVSKGVWSLEGALERPQDCYVSVTWEEVPAANP
jgi:FkbH-like protein